MIDRGRPDLMTFPKGLEIRTGIDEVQGCRRAALADYLGCTDNALKPLLPEQIGQFAHRNKLYPLWDPQVVFDLVDHPKVIASRARRSKRMTAKKREGVLRDLVASWDVAGTELVGVVIRGFKSLEDVVIPLEGTTVLLGRNGSGKTNILEAIGLELGHDQTTPSLRRLPDDGGLKRAHPSGMGAVFRLVEQDSESLNTFLDKYLYTLDKTAVLELRAMLEIVLRQPLVIDWRNRTFGRVATGRGRMELAALSSGVDPVRVSKSTLASIEKDAWLVDAAAALSAPERGLVELGILPGSLELPKIEVAVVDGDPQLLEEELEDRIPGMLEEVDRAKDPLQRFIDGFWPDDDDRPNRSTIQNPQVPIWLSWLRCSTELSRLQILAACRLGDPDLGLSGPSGDTAWLAFGSGSRDLQNTADVASATDRSDVRHLLRDATKIVSDWFEIEDPEAGSLPTDHWVWNFVEEAETINGALGLDLYADSSPSDKGSGWLNHSRLGAVIRSDLVEQVYVVEQLANELAPEFVSVRGRILLNLLSPADWDAQRAKVSVRFVTAESRVLALDAIGRGTQRWAAASVREALRKSAALREESSEGDSVHSVRILLIDEPEMGLHPDAQDQAARWCIAAGRQGQRVLVATHSPSMLEMSPTDATLVRVSMSKGTTHVAPIAIDALVGLDYLAESLGLGRSGLLHLPRGFIVVEGPADVSVLEGLLGADLRTQRIIPIPLHGAHKYRALIQPELLKAMGKPMAVMFDDVRRDVLDGKRQAEANEERTLLTLVERVPDIHPISFDAPDVVAALPDDAVRRIVPKFPGWEAILDDWHTKSGDFKNFKAYAMHRCGRSEYEATRFIEEVLEQVEPDDALPKSFGRAASEILAWADSISPIGTSGISGEELM